MTYDPKAEERKRQAESFGDAEFKDGAWRWKSNGRVPFSDMLGTWSEHGYITGEELIASVEAREAEQEAFFAEYRAAQAARTPEQLAEERAEMLAAFGPGETIVNVLTGERTQL